MATFSDSGQRSGGPTEVLAQSCRRINVAISLCPTKMSAWRAGVSAVEEVIWRKKIARPTEQQASGGRLATLSASAS